MKNKQILIICTALIIVALMCISYVSAYKLLCLTDGQKLPSKLTKPRYVCEHDSCTVCVTDNYYPTSLNLCHNLANCNLYDPGNTTGPVIDTQPPVISLNSPTNNAKYSSKYVLFSIGSDEEATFYYSLDNGEKWVRLTANTKTYTKSISLKDGQQDVTIKAVDSKGNEATKNVKFYVDSTKPKISKTSPGKGFANGTFEVWFTEANPASVIIDYGNLIKGRKTVSVPLTSCTHDDAGKYYCSISVSLSDYNNQNIDYKFKVIDIVGNNIESKPVTLKVDISPPVVNNPTTFLKVSGKSANFNISITEANFDKALYMDNSASRPSWKSLCTSLKNGICQKKVTFSPGDHIVDVMISDDALNSVTKRVQFVIN